MVLPLDQPVKPAAVATLLGRTVGDAHATDDATVGGHRAPVRLAAYRARLRQADPPPLSGAHGFAFMTESRISSHFARGGQAAEIHA